MNFEIIAATKYQTKTFKYVLDTNDKSNYQKNQFETLPAQPWIVLFI